MTSMRAIVSAYLAMRDRSQAPPSAMGSQLDQIQDSAWAVKHGGYGHAGLAAVRTNDEWDAYADTQRWMDVYAILSSLWNVLTPFECQVMELLNEPLGIEPYERQARESELCYTVDTRGQISTFTTIRDEHYLRDVKDESGDQVQDLIVVGGEMVIYRSPSDVASLIPCSVESVLNTRRSAHHSMINSDWFRLAEEIVGGVHCNE